MIITCERCDTEFQLDDARVPMSGARVRCSRCKHAFFVLPPAASRDQAIEQAAGAALADDPAPAITEDLVSASAERDDDSESDWQFNGKLPAGPGDSSPDLDRSDFARIPEPAEEPEADADSEPSLELASQPERAEPPARPAARAEAHAPEPAEDLGSPIDWDFFDKAAKRSAPAPAAPQRASARALVIPIDDAASAPGLLRDGSPLLRRAVDAAGWLALLGLCAVALVRGLVPPAPAQTSWPAPAPGLALEEVRGRWLDNASLGRLYVVSGRVENRSPHAAALPPLALELRDASGRALGAPIPLRGASSPGALRDADAAALATAGSDLPGGLLPGVSWDFEVVAWPLPAEAARFAIRARS